MPSRAKMIFRALLLKCPLCGGDRAYSGFFTMKKRCGACDLFYEREPGYFLGATYFNYGATVIACFAVTPIFVFGFDWKIERVVPVWIGLGTIVGLWFFRHARLIWLALDLSWDPPTESDFLERTDDVRPLD